ncbi:MAG: complex I NDUFA9 subunit family protein [Alphaproteobacteria bacterium]
MQIKRVTVFGGSGFIGRHIVRRLAGQGIIVRAAVRHPDSALFLKPMGAVGQVVPVFGDVKNEAAVAAAVADADAVINAVGLAIESRKYRFDDVHVKGASVVAHAAKQAGAKHFVHLSGIGADADIDSKYVRARAGGEAAVKSTLPDATILRPSIVFGPEDHVFNRIAVAARWMPALRAFGGGMANVPPVYVGDVADAAVRALFDAHARGKVYQLGGPAIYTYRQLMELVLKEIGRRRRIVSVPFVIANLQAIMLSLLPKPPLTRDMLKLLAIDNVVQPGAAGLAELGITPTAVEAILPTYMDRYRRGGRTSQARFA